MAEQEIVKQSQLGVPIANKTILGQLTSYKDGTAKWTYAKDVNPLQAGFGDRSTFTLSKKPDGTWDWSPTTSTSISNLAQRENLTVDQVNKSLYVKSGDLPTSQTQAVLNAGNATNLGASVASKLGVPGSKGTATVTGALPSQVSGAFAGQAGATPDPENPDAAQQEGATESGVQQGLTNLTNTQIKGSDKTRLVTQYPSDSLLRYPINMDTKQDCIKFTMLEYRPRKLSTKLLGEGKSVEDRPEATGVTRGSTVVLPIQPSISDTNTVRWGEDTMNAFQAIAAAAALGTIKDGVVGATEAISGIAELFAKTSGSLANTAAAHFAGEAAQVKGLVPRVLGGVINPNIELLFEGPQLRTFQFNFTLSAREPEESKNIRNIIRFFKQGMSVKRAETDLFLKAPHTFEIKYIYAGGDDHPWINRIKECALTGCSVNYTPSGSYATFTDGAMTSYEISLQFAELEAIYDDDYKNSGGKGNESEIGY